MKHAEYEALWNDTVKMLAKLGEQITTLEGSAPTPTNKARMAAARGLYEKLLSELQEMHSEFNESGVSK